MPRNRSVIRKQATKAMMHEGVAKRLEGVYGEGDRARKASHAVVDAIMSAISQGFDKIRLNDDLHLRVKVVKGGRVKPLKVGHEGLPLDADGKLQLPDRVVVTLCSTAALDRASQTYLKTKNHTEDGQPAPAPSNGASYNWISAPIKLP